VHVVELYCFGVAVSEQATSSSLSSRRPPTTRHLTSVAGQPNPPPAAVTGPPSAPASTLPVIIMPGPSAPNYTVPGAADDESVGGLGRGAKEASRQRQAQVSNAGGTKDDGKGSSTN